MSASNVDTARPVSQASADGARPLRVRLLHTLYPHMGAHAGMVQLPRAFDRALVDAQICAVTDGDDDFPIRAETVRAWLRPQLKRGGMAWYKLSDLHAELGALGALARGAVDIVHFLDGEHSAQLVPRIMRRVGARRSRTVATFHQPPATLGTLIDRRVVEALDLVTVVSPTQAEWFAATVPHVRTEVVLLGFITFPVFVQAAWGALWNKRAKFTITEKQGGTEALPFRALWPQLAMWLLNLAALLWGINTVVLETDWSVISAMVWTGYHFLLLSSVFYYRAAGVRSAPAGVDPVASHRVTPARISTTGT